MNKTQMSQVLDQAQVVLKERGYTSFERRTERTEFSDYVTFMVAKKDDGSIAEAYPRKTQSGMTYVIYAN
jgi:hypothetical protein